MSLENAIQKLTQVIQAATPAPGTGPAHDAPFGREVSTPPKRKCVLEIDGQQVFNPYIPPIVDVTRRRTLDSLDHVIITVVQLPLSHIRH